MRVAWHDPKGTNMRGADVDATERNDHADGAHVCISSTGADQHILERTCITTLLFFRRRFAPQSHTSWLLTQHQTDAWAVVLPRGWTSGYRLRITRRHCLAPLLTSLLHKNKQNWYQTGSFPTASHICASPVLHKSRDKPQVV
jgi:hypothetical protein